MILSSPERMPARGGLRADGSACRCDWHELGAVAAQPGPPAADAALLREQELEEAYRRGRAEGEQAAHARARRELESSVAAARAVVREVREARAGWDRVLEENLAALATAVAARLVQREIAADPELRREMVHQALSAFPTREDVRVRLHPTDLAALVGGTADAEAGPVRWVADEDVLPGGCLVEGPERIVDGRLDEGLKRIFQVLAHG